MLSEIVNQLPGFKSKTRNFYRKMYELCKEVTFMQDDVLYRENDESGHIYFTMMGQITLCKDLKMNTPISFKLHKFSNSTSIRAPLCIALKSLDPDGKVMEY